MIYIFYLKLLLLLFLFIFLLFVFVLFSDCCDLREFWELNWLSEVWELFFIMFSWEGGSMGWRLFWKVCIEELEGNVEISCYLI